MAKAHATHKFDTFTIDTNIHTHTHTHISIYILKNIISTGELLNNHREIYDAASQHQTKIIAFAIATMVVKPNAKRNSCCLEIGKISLFNGIT